MRKQTKFCGRSLYELELPGGLGRQEDDSVAVGDEDLLAVVRPGPIEVFEIDLDDDDAERSVVVAHGRREVVARLAADRADAVEPPAPAFQRVLEVGTVGEVDADKGGRLPPIAPRQGQTGPVHHVDRRRAGAVVDLLQVAVDERLQSVGGRLLEQRPHPRVSGDDLGQIFEAPHLVAEAERVEVHAVHGRLAQRPQRHSLGDDVAERGGGDEQRRQRDHDQGPPLGGAQGSALHESSDSRRGLKAPR